MKNENELIKALAAAGRKIELDAALDAAYIGPLVNEDGDTYGHRYDGKKLTAFQKDLLKYGEDGTLQRDVWNQVWFE